MGILTGLTLLFTAAKLFGFIDWSWWLVLLPSIIGLAFTVVLFILAALAKVYLD